MKRLLIFGLLIFWCELSFGQDSLRTDWFERYWTKPRIVPKIGAGLQENAFVEIGVAYHNIYIHPLSLVSSSPYFTVDGIIDDDVFIIGPKVGYEFTAGLFGIATDLTYYTDFSDYTFMVTPKIGLSLLGSVNLFYGYNIPLSPEEFKSISRNRFSLTFNLNKDYLNIKEAPRK